ncbi:MAG: AbrB/MazE/SpoVT family DNA-binding domain-containing protein [Sulfuritalea sp.]|nr:AbrB/MazE/SpoVT family DNA-binding domain-containing protein [Sulfuritalea sp.]
MEAILSSKGQITLPKPLRERLHLNTGDRVEFLLGDDGRVELVPISASVKRLKGMVPVPAKAVTLEQMDVAIAGRAGRG